MLKILALLIGIAHAQNYLVQPDIPTAQTRSQQQCQAVGCDANTKYWWPVQPLTDSTAAVVILPGTSQDVTWDRRTGACAVGCGLTPAEQSALQTATQMGTKLPWVISEPAFMARFTPIQISKANSSVNPAISVPWANVKAAATVNLQSQTIINMVNAMVGDQIITAANALTILTPVAVAVPPP